MRKRRLITRYLLGLALALAGVTSAAIAQTTAPKGNGKIASVVYEASLSTHGIWVMNPDGSDRRQLTEGRHEDRHSNPAWSPDGTQIAYLKFFQVGIGSWAYEIWLMNADGSNQRRLTQPDVIGFTGPAWSPDGARIAFTGGCRPRIYPCLYVMNADGSNQTVIGEGWSPSWSPDGSKLVVTDLGGLYILNADGSGRRQITAPQNPSPGLRDYDSYPAWSPDGTRISFSRSVNFDRDGDSGSSTFWTVNPDGTGLTQVSNMSIYNHNWSPDGAKIIFSSLVNNASDLFVMNADGSGITNITNSDGLGEAMPSWQPVALAASGVNPIDNHEFFVRQQYRDFLNREAEPEGLQFYLDILNRCNPADDECVRFVRGVVSANFFRSPEFQRKGNFVMYLYMVSIGQRPVTAAELPIKNDPALNDRPNYQEFMTDLASISTPNDDPVLTEQKKNELANNWMTRPQIVSIYGSLNNAQFVQKLIDVAGVTPANQNWVADLNAGTKTRAQVLRQFAESPEVDEKFFKQSFVTMEYFGYLRRKPEDCHDPANWAGSDPSQCGFIFHNHRFTLHPDPHVIQNIIVRGFIESPEYRRRFGSN